MFLLFQNPYMQTILWAGNKTVFLTLAKKDMECTKKIPICLAKLWIWQKRKTSNASKCKPELNRWGVNSLDTNMGKIWAICVAHCQFPMNVYDNVFKILSMQSYKAFSLIPYILQVATVYICISVSPRDTRFRLKLNASLSGYKKTDMCGPFSRSPTA